MTFESNWITMNYCDNNKSGILLHKDVLQSNVRKVSCMQHPPSTNSTSREEICIVVYVYDLEYMIFTLKHSYIMSHCQRPGP